jgi:magnesium chelatase subunit I
MSSSASAPSINNLGALRDAGYGFRTLREELCANLHRFMREGRPIFTGIVGYGETVIPALENALLCGHDLIFLGERGQAKTRMIRAITGLLDEWVPEVAGTEIHDDPFRPVSAFAKNKIASQGDDTEIAWLHRDDRYGEKLATPDTSIADLIGDVDPIKVAEGHHLSDEYTLHFGLLPRTNRGIFCINELPDLTEKVQVGMFNVMEERDIQVKGYKVRMPIDVLVVASANPEDYTSRGRIITPLKDRYAAQIRTHYPLDRSIEIEIADQEAKLPHIGETPIHLPEYMREIVAELTFQARSSADISQSSGVSVRMTIANLETLVANAQRRALALNEAEAVPRISDMPALLASSRGKIELEYAGAERSEDEILLDLMQRAVRVVFEERVRDEDVKPVVESFDQGWQVEVAASLPSSSYLDGLDEIAGLRSLTRNLAGSDSDTRLASAIEFVLEGLHLANRLNKEEVSGATRFGKLRETP